MSMEFHKVLARYYHGWFRDAKDSAIYCSEKGDKIGAEKYSASADKYLDIILDNWDAIEFFSQGDNAFILDECLPKEWRGYK